MKWKIPEPIKIYEALGCLADNRIKNENNEIHCYSSSGNKFYTIKYSEQENAIISNDNGSYWKSYLGYPSIAYLMKINKIKYNNKFAQALKGIKWKDVNQQNKNDFDKTIKHVNNSLLLQGINLKRFKEEIQNILSQIENLNLNYLNKKMIPPKGY
jgi:hypothetical protein